MCERSFRLDSLSLGGDLARGLHRVIDCIFDEGNVFYDK
jgi:hypothetical protein